MSPWFRAVSSTAGDRRPVCEFMPASDWLQCLAMHGQVWLAGRQHTNGLARVTLVFTLSRGPDESMEVGRQSAGQRAGHLCSTWGCGLDLRRANMLIGEGACAGHYRIDAEQLLVDGHDVSRTTVAACAVAVLDRGERRDALRPRVAIAR